MALLVENACFAVCFSDLDNGQEVMIEAFLGCKHLKANFDVLWERMVAFLMEDPGASTHFECLR